jgi:hypothetical protein
LHAPSMRPAPKASRNEPSSCLRISIASRSRKPQRPPQSTRCNTGSRTVNADGYSKTAGPDFNLARTGSSGLPRFQYGPALGIISPCAGPMGWLSVPVPSMSHGGLERQ